MPTICFLTKIFLFAQKLSKIKCCINATLSTKDGSCKVDQKHVICYNTSIVSNKATKEQICRLLQQSNTCKKKRNSWACPCWKPWHSSKRIPWLSPRKPWKLIGFLWQKAHACLHRLTRIPKLQYNKHILTKVRS